MNTSLEDCLQTALDAADIAREITGRHFRTRLAVDNKQDRSPVTIADRETEEAICALIRSRHPGHGIFGEEGGNQIRQQHWHWIIDPIDGTRSFTSGRPTFGTLIALMDGRKPALGLIDQGILDERWIGVTGTGTTFNGKPCITRRETRMEHCSIYATSPDMFDGEAMIRFRRLADRCQNLVWGGDCYCYGLLAAGYTDIVCEADLYPYDYLPLVSVVEGAGGIITDWDGNALSLDSGDRVLATANEKLHLAALALLNR